MRLYYWQRRFCMTCVLSTLAILISLLTQFDLIAQDTETIKPFQAKVAAETMVVPEGFHVSLFASEPDVRQPISFCIDDRGRLWVAEAYNYPFRDKEPQDRILILEDTDGDGKADKRTVFFDKLGYVTGIEVGFGGVWVMSPPQMLFIPDKNKDDKPDAEPKVLLDGFGNTTSAHNIANGFTWGPDGWLYAGHGRTSPSDVGPPGTPAKDRIHHDGGVFRYHPIRNVFENFCDGSTNPWGVAFDDYGQAFISNCVNPHLFHAVQGAHFEPWRGRKSSQYAFERMPTIADHLHWKGKIAGDTKEISEAGGGHAHCGTMVYLGDNWPDKYRHSIYMGNVHGRRINNDTLERQGSSYTASHLPDVMLAKDPWFKAVTIQSGPHGAVYVSDWSDTGECHDYRNTHRETGRLFRVAYGKLDWKRIDIAIMNNAELVELQLHKNDWRVAHARRVLQERFADGQDMSEVHESLHKMFAEKKDVTRKLRALWALFVTGGTTPSFLEKQLSHESEYVRAWSIRLLAEPGDVSPTTLKQFVEMARKDASPFVRLHLASAAARISLDQRWSIVEQLALHAEDVEDEYLPLMLWYAIEPLVPKDMPRVVEILKATKIPKIQSFIARRAALGDGATERIELLSDFLAVQSDAATSQQVLSGMFTAIEGRRDLKMPRSWPAARAILAKSDNQDVQKLTARVGLWLQDPGAVGLLYKTLSDAKLEKSVRENALQDLLNIQEEKLPPTLFRLLDQKDFRRQALRGLANFNHPDTATEILERYAELSHEEKQDALATLTTRLATATKLLVAVREKQVSLSDFTAPTIRQLQQFDDDEIQRQIKSIWGVVGDSSKETEKVISNYKKKLNTAYLAAADISKGKELYAKNCAACHTLFGEGGKIGPDLTGANRGSLDYLLENLVDPSALVPANYQLTVIATVDGRVLSGMVIEENDKVLKLQTPTELILLPNDKIDQRKLTRKSMMPEALLKDLTDAELRNLIAFLSGVEEK
jgi:putative membrane-bound dehydrogenase-like protein